MPLFDHLQPEALDPIMAGFQEFGADPRADKVNLGVGMYYDEDGRIPILGVVRAAEARLTSQVSTWGYLQPDGLPALREAAKRLVFGDALADSMGSRIVTVQSLGGTGALKLGADVIRRLAPDATVMLSRPTWGNHPSIFAGAGLHVAEYPYFDPATGGVDWPAMRDAVAAMAPGTVLLLHACCHNPTGADLRPEDWQELAAAHPGPAASCHSWTWPTPDSPKGWKRIASRHASWPGSACRYSSRPPSPSPSPSTGSGSGRIVGRRRRALPKPRLVGDQTEGRHTHQLLHPAQPWRAAGVHHPGRRRRCGPDWEAELDGMRDRIKQMRQGLVSTPGRQQRPGFQPIPASARAVLLLWPGCREHGPAKDRVRHLRRQRRPASAWPR